jgi:hypothetical protein
LTSSSAVKIRDLKLQIPTSKHQRNFKPQASSFNQPHRKLLPPFRLLRRVPVHPVVEAAPLDFYGILFAIRIISIRQLTYFRHGTAIDNPAGSREAVTRILTK